jgi:hypothetical protein
VSAATQKKRLPRMKTWAITYRKGWKYVARWIGARRVLSAQGMKMPAVAPQIKPDKTRIVTTSEAAQRPPR